MSGRIHAGLVVLWVAGLVSCIPIGGSIPPQVLATITSDANATASPTPFGPSIELSTPTVALLPEMPIPQPYIGTPSTPASIDSASLPYYSLDATLDYAAHTVSVDETILYQNNTGVELVDLVLAVEPNLWKHCFTLSGMLINGQTLKDTKLESGRLAIPLPVPLAAGDSLNIILHYELVLPPADPYHVFGYSEYQTNLVDWYPFIVPYSSGWILHPPANVGEHLVYPETTFDVTFRLKDPSAQLTLATSAPGVEEVGVWHYHMSRARTFVISASPDYQVTSTMINGISLNSYFFESERKQALAAYEEVAKALSTYSDLFGPYPYESLSIVESPYFDGMEYDGLFLLSRDYYIHSDGTMLNNLVDIAVHETAHQWWFGLVGDDQAMEPWLDEAMATYSESLYYEKNHPDITGWQEFRVDSFSPSGWVDTDIYSGHDFRAYANAVYLRGALFLVSLRQKIGDEAFFAFLKDYESQMSGKISSSADFFHILRQHTNIDLTELISIYFRNPH